MVEDGGGDSYVHWVTAEGQICSFARNPLSDSEMTGVCFSPNGKAMFVSIQVNGLTLAATGPFPNLTMPGDGDSTDTTSTTDTGETTSDSGSSSGSGSEGTGDEVAGESDSTGDAGIVAMGDGCNCTTTGESSALGAMVTGLTTLALGALVREPE